MSEKSSNGVASWLWGQIAQDIFAIEAVENISRFPFAQTEINVSEIIEQAKFNFQTVKSSFFEFT